LRDERDAVRRQLNQKISAGKASALKRLNRDATAVDFPLNGCSTPTPTISKKETQKEKELKIDKPSLVPRDKVQEILSSFSKGLHNHSVNGTRYDDPSVRKTRWEQKIIDELNHRLPEVNVRTIVAAYMDGDPKAKKIFNDVDSDIKRQEAT
jgi:hypothetical protein